MQPPPSTATGDLIRALAEFTAAATLEDLSGLACQRVQEHLLDTVGVGLAGYAEPGAAIIAEMMDAERSTGSARSLVSGAHLMSWDAAWANGVFTNMLDFDDTGFTHPSVCLVPAALAIGEARDLTGRNIELALTVGYEVTSRLNNVVGGRNNPKMRERGIHPMSVCGAIGAAAVVASALNLTTEQVLVAFGLAASSSFGITEHFGTWAKGVHAGNAARAGVQSALMAERNYFASKTAVDGRYGLLHALFGEGNYELSRGLPGLGEGWQIAAPGADMKLHPACGGTRGITQAALKLRSERIASVDDISHVVVTVAERVLDSLQFNPPERGYEGKFSIVFPVAAALLDGVVTIDSFTDQSLGRAEMQDLLGRISLKIVPGGYERSERDATPIEVFCRDGRVLREDPPKHPRGKRQNRLSYEEIVTKFRDCARRVFSEEKTEAALATLENLESVTVRQLMDALVR
jgi:2-methylcitrate dehydratase PrpD